jgi:hypothetical protein
LHATAVLVVSEDGGRRSFYLRGVERPEVQRRAEGYRRFRKARAAIAKLNAEILSAADSLLETILEPHIPRRDEQAGDDSDDARTKPRGSD